MQRSAFLTRIKDAIFSVYGERELDSIKSNATPREISEWKASPKTKAAYNKLFEKIDPDNSEDTYIMRILDRVWPGGATPSTIRLAYTITVCQVVLSDHYENLTLKDARCSNRLRKNVVSNIVYKI